MKKMKKGKKEGREKEEQTNKKMKKGKKEG